VPGRPRGRPGGGRAGTGKTFALGIARHAWQLDGYRLLAAAPTGIATISLQGEGFEDVATCDRLLGDLDRGRERLDARTVLVIDEAGMVVGAWPAELISQLMTRAAITITARGRATKARVVAPLRWPWVPTGRAGLRRWHWWQRQVGGRLTWLPRWPLRGARSRG
jgi:AAA domain